MNCILQIMVHCPLVARFFLGDRHNRFECLACHGNVESGLDDDAMAAPRRACLACEMDILLTQCFSGDTAPYSPHSFLHAMWCSCDHFAGYEQQDAHEFLVDCLDQLSEDLKPFMVLGEDDESRAEPVALTELFDNVRKNYFRIYLHYTYFNLFRNFYFQLNNLFAYVLLIPTIALGVITLGIMNQIIRAFSEVTSSFQYLVRSWSTIIDLISVFKRLQAFEAAFLGKSPPKLDLEYINTEGRVDK